MMRRRRLAAFWSVFKPPWKRQDAMRIMLSEGRRIADPDEAEALGLTVEARRLRQAGNDDQT